MRGRELQSQHGATSQVPVRPVADAYRSRSILPLHDPSSRATLLGWLSVDALKPAAERGDLDLDAPLSSLQSSAAEDSEGARPVKTFKRGKTYKGASSLSLSSSGLSFSKETLTFFFAVSTQSSRPTRRSRSSRRSSRRRAGRAGAAQRLPLSRMAVRFPLSDYTFLPLADFRT